MFTCLPDYLSLQNTKVLLSLRGEKVYFAELEFFTHRQFLQNLRRRTGIFFRGAELKILLHKNAHDLVDN